MRRIVDWLERAYSVEDAAAFAAAGLSPLASRLLAARGVAPEEREAFLDKTNFAYLVDPCEIPGIPEAVTAIMPFVSSRRKIVVFGDYDCDGISATSILVQGLRRLEADVEPFIPVRHGEGYGMTRASLDRLYREHPGAELVITVDNGVNAVDEVRELKARGIAVVVTDHHLPGPELPAADALVDPRVKSTPGCDDLCGAGIAFFLMNALARAANVERATQGRERIRNFSGPLLVLAGLATVADIMPLRGQNRRLVASSLVHFSRHAPIGLRELLSKAGRSAEDLSSRDYGFALAPRINASGRMKTPLVAFELVTTADRERARNLAVEVDNLNVDRKTEEARADREARAAIGTMEGLAAVVAQGEDWHQGVIGIVAARLMESANVPVAVVTHGVHGSARAPEGYNVRDALEKASEALVRFGGHAAAGGFTVKDGKLEDFRRLFVSACAEQKGLHPESAGAHRFDGWVRPEDLTLGFLEEIKGFEPFGEGNEEPEFGLRDVTFADVRPMGFDGKHLSFKFKLPGGKELPRGVWWGHGGEVDALRAKANSRWDVLFTPYVSDWGGDEHVELRVTDLRPADD